MEGPSKQYLSEFIKNLREIEENKQCNVLNTSSATRKAPIPKFVIDSNHSLHKNLDVSKKNASSSTTSLYKNEEHPKNFTNQTEFVDEFCILKSTFTPTKNVIKPASTKKVAASNKQLELTTKQIQTKSMLHRNIFTQIEPVVIQPSSYGTRIKEITRAEKTTYCRPVVNKYTQEFVQQTIEKNARLQDLIKRLVIARQVEKENDSWNNYINELKNKHAHYDPGTSNVDTLMTHNNTIKLIEDYNNIRQTNNLYEHYYNDNIVYTDSDANQNGVIISKRYNSKNNSTYKYRNNSYCYPTSSQAQLTRLSQDRRSSQFSDQRQSIRSIEKRMTGSVVLDRNLRKISDGIPGKFCKCDEKLSLKSTNAQTEPINLNNLIKSDDNLIKDYSDKDFKVAGRKSKDSRGSNDVDRIIREKTRESRNHSKQVSLANIEYKLDTLIKSINTFITEVKAKKSNDTSHKSVAVSISIENIHKTTKKDKNENEGAKPDNTSRIEESFGLPKREEIICGMSTANSVYPPKTNSTIDDILIEEQNKSDQVKKDIENILTKNDHHCAVQITFDIPTKEGATEVTESFYDSFDTLVEEVDSCRSARRMTIAVNTDPMGFLALLRVSTEALKQILSYVPNIDYLAYLARLQQAPRIKPANEIQPLFECNICGAAFRRPSHLSDHIHQHNLGPSRNCCVCRHEIDANHRHSELFRCRHCGQVFTRAYCRELHERACARNAGKRDTTPTGLLLLS